MKKLLFVLGALALMTACTPLQLQQANTDLANLVKTPDQFLQAACPQIKIAVNTAAAPGVIPNPKVAGAFLAASVVVNEACAQTATVPTLQSLSGALPQIQQAVEASTLTASEKQYISLGISIMQQELSNVVQVAQTAPATPPIK